jgi:DNA-binding CsgD family transcriptional regulator
MGPTARELAVLAAIEKPRATIKSAAADLGLSESAARGRLRSLYRRLGVSSSSQAIAALLLSARPAPGQERPIPDPAPAWSLVDERVRDVADSTTGLLLALLLEMDDQQRAELVAAVGRPGASLAVRVAITPAIGLVVTFETPEGLGRPLGFWGGLLPLPVARALGLPD